MTRYYWYFAPYDTWSEENGGITFANSSHDAFNLQAPKKALQNPPPDYDVNGADNLLMEAELVAGGFDEKKHWKPISNRLVVPLVQNVTSITMKLYKNE